MARIRTIKPEFWTDEKLTECSLSARLLFIGTWNFADDAGNLDRSPKQIKARVFPLDVIDCEPLLQELIDQGLLIEYLVNEKLFLHINGFTKHQIINRPSKPTCPDFDESVKVNEHSVSAHHGREGKGKEGKGKEGLKDLVKSSESDNCPHEKIIAIYHEVLFELPKVQIWNDKRKSALMARWKESADRQNLEWWEQFFTDVKKSDFLMGKKTDFKANLEWLLLPKNFPKVLEGNYTNNNNNFGKQNYSNSVQESRLNVARQIMGGLNGNDRQTFDINPIGQNESDRTGIPETIDGVWEPVDGEMAGD